MSGLKAIAEHSKGFVYAISRVGITGQAAEHDGDAAALVARIRRWTKLPVAVGFGISNAEHVAQVAEFADAAVIGSAIVELIERSTPEAAPGAVARFIEGLRRRKRRWPGKDSQTAISPAMSCGRRLDSTLVPMQTSSRRCDEPAA